VDEGVEYRATGKADPGEEPRDQHRERKAKPHATSGDVETQAQGVELGGTEKVAHVSGLGRVRPSC
jgi:hypothetical protein